MPQLKAASPRAARTPQIVQVTDMTGGVDLRRAPSLLAPNRARTLSNWSLEEPGALIVAPGDLVVSSSNIFSAPPQGGTRVYLRNTVFTLLAGGGAIYRPDDTWSSTGPVYSTISTGQVFFPHDRDLVAVMDGANRPRQSTNGSSWGLMGIDAPSSAAVLSSVQSGGGALTTGEYAIAYTYKHRGTAYESNGSSESTITLTASTANSIHATASPSTDGKVDAYVWYARHKLPDAESILRKVSSGAASTYTFLSSAWTTNDEIPTNHNVPTVLSFGAVWKSRWWARDATVTNRIRFTELFQPQAWPSLYYIDIPFERGDAVVGIQPLGDTLIIYGQSGKFLIIGQTALDFEVRPSQGADTGAFGPRAFARVEQASLHASADGSATFDGASDQSLEPDIATAWRDLAQNAASTALDTVSLLHDYQRHEVRHAVPRVYPTAARGEWVLHLDRTRDQEGVPAWTTTDRDAGLYIHWNGNEATVGNRGRLFFLPSTVGRVLEIVSTSAALNSSNVRAEYEGPTLSFGIHHSMVVGTHIDYETNDGEFSVELMVDGISQGAQAIEIGAGGPLVGSAIVGTAVLGGSQREQVYVEWPLEAQGRTATFNAVYQGQARFRWFGYAHTIVPEPGPRKLT